MQAQSFVPPITETGAEAPPAAAPERPEWLPEGFNSPEDLAKSYAELRAKMSREGAPKPEEATAEDAPNEAAEETPEEGDDVETAAKANGVDMDALAFEFAQNGALKEESYAALEGNEWLQGIAKGFGLPVKDLVNRYIAGVQAEAGAIDAAYHELSGGKERFSTILDWAGQGGIPANEIAAFNAVSESGNTQAAHMLWERIVAKYDAQNTSAPARTIAPTGDSRKSDGGVQPYSSTAEMTRDMDNPKYKSDPAFRAKVERRLAVTNW